MRNKGYQNYFDDEVLTANSTRSSCNCSIVERSDSIAAARRHLRVGDIRARSRAISKAMAIVTELSQSLDMSAGGELSRNLAELYGYIAKLLIQANAEQCEAPLSEAERLLTTLLEAWNAACQPSRSARSSDPQPAAFGWTTGRCWRSWPTSRRPIGSAYSFRWASMIALATASAETSYLPDCTSSRNCSIRPGSRGGQRLRQLGNVGLVGRSRPTRCLSPLRASARPAPSFRPPA